MTDKWDTRFLGLAQFIAGWSRDVSTKVGAVIVDADKRIISIGFNGFPAGVSDFTERYEDRDIKLRLIVHAELNAILFAQRSLKGCTLYTWPFMPCARCAGPIIQTGITRVVAPTDSTKLMGRWKDEFDAAILMFEESGVEIILE